MLMEAKEVIYIHIQLFIFVVNSLQSCYISENRRFCRSLRSLPVANLEWDLNLLTEE